MLGEKIRTNIATKNMNVKHATKISGKNIFLIL